MIKRKKGVAFVLDDSFPLVDIEYYERRNLSTPKHLEKKKKVEKK